jgi:O-Antigen ligase
MTSRRFVTLWDALVAFSMLLALETQLRTGDGPLGPGEILLLLWLLPIFVLEFLRAPRHVPRPFWDVLRFWFVLTAALSMGIVVTIVRDVVLDWSLVAHDIAAYLLLAALTCVLTVLPDSFDRLHRMLWMIVLFGASLLLLQLANAAEWFALSGIDPWYWDRMRGWSDNPNQFALLCLLIGFLGVALAERARGIGPKVLAALCAAIGLGTGILAKSNAFSAVIITGLLLFALSKMGRAFARAERRGFPAFALAVAATSALGGALFVIGPAMDLRIDALKATSSMARDGDADSEDAALRVQLWTQAIKVGTQSWGLGLGPGPHLEIPQSIVASRRDGGEPINLKHPKPGLAANFEAHNTVLELFVQGGLMAVVGFVWMVGLGACRSWKAGFDGMVALLFAMIAFGSFHVVFRHPMVWFAICLAITERPLLQPMAAATWRNRLSIAPALQPRFAMAPSGLAPDAVQPERRF